MSSSINLECCTIPGAGVFNNETAAKFTQGILHVIVFSPPPRYTWIIGVAWFVLRAEVHALSVEK